MGIQSIRCALSCCRRSEEEETKCSQITRITTAALGGIILLVGILTFSGIHGLHALGTIGGGVFTIGGFALLLIAACIRCVKQEKRETFTSDSDTNHQNLPTFSLGVDQETTNRVGSSNFQQDTEKKQHHKSNVPSAMSPSTSSTSSLSSQQIQQHYALKQQQREQELKRFEEDHKKKVETQQARHAREKQQFKIEHDREMQEIKSKDEEIEANLYKTVIEYPENISQKEAAQKGRQIKELIKAWKSASSANQDCSDLEQQMRDAGWKKPVIASLKYFPLQS